ncbi:MarR family winged helix-turn-helix transcriptional regulator [Rufibacter quisquiliarum]|uniref:DNA-binding MarR family transcriptional regulator n=1 Tax=Rufibacter quisquiliarum TaxID=1549639 RepID=A0A839GR38_9BACT|nr:MarR family transcriptional regulator [Rufibacter quisquiliarum]MBA9077975.1 DNA-binding MarR family transcriptional regulator [Rufibacter quisquiliarum]
MKEELVKQIRKLTQQHAYTSLQMHEAVARKAGLSGTDHKYLGFLLEKGEMTAGDFAKATGLTTGAVTGLIDRLEKKKFLSRHFAEGDRRKVLLKPNTELIMTLLIPLYEEFRRETENLISSFSTSEIKVIERYFSQALAIMNQRIEILSQPDANE